MNNRAITDHTLKAILIAGLLGDGLEIQINRSMTRLVLNHILISTKTRTIAIENPKSNASWPSTDQTHRVKPN